MCPEKQKTSSRTANKTTTNDGQLFLSRHRGARGHGRIAIGAYVAAGAVTIFKYFIFSTTGGQGHFHSEYLCDSSKDTHKDRLLIWVCLHARTATLIYGPLPRIIRKPIFFVQPLLAHAHHRHQNETKNAQVQKE